MATTRVRRRPAAPSRERRSEPPPQPSSVLLGISSALFAMSMILSLLLLYAR